MSGQGVARVWIGARDLVNDDNIVLVNTGVLLNPGTWDHALGDCVFLSALSLDLEDCEKQMNYVCEVLGNTV